MATLAADAAVIRPGELAGRLRELATIARRGAARDVGGGASDGWSPVDHVWAAIEPVGQGALVAGEAIRARPRWRIIVRSGVDLAIDDRIVWRGAPVRIRALTADPRLPDRLLAEGEEEP